MSQFELQIRIGNKARNGQIEEDIVIILFNFLVLKEYNIEITHQQQFANQFNTQIHISLVKDMSTSTSSAKKPIIRRGRQKRDILDDEDLKKQQQLERGIVQGRVKQQSGDIFDTAKLDKNYFVRQENKPAHLQSQIFNFDDYEEKTNQSNQINLSNQVTIPTKELLSRQDSYKQAQESQSEIRKKQQKKSMTVNKRREQRKKQRSQNIFDEQQEENDEQEDQYTPPKEEHQQVQLTKKQKNLSTIQMNHQKRPSQHYHKQQPPKTTNVQKQSQQNDEGEVISEREKGASEEGDSEDNNQDENEDQNKDEDQFDNVIKHQQQRSQEQEKPYILHIQLGKLSNKQDRKRFYHQTLKPNYVAHAYFKRFSSGLSQVYQLCGEDHRPLLFCENQRGCIGANYYISITKQMNKNNSNYLGKLRGNASGSIYSLYDDGIQPKNQLNRSDWRVSMATIEYENNFMGMNGPRKIKVITPSANLLQEDTDFYKLSQQQSLLNFKPPVITQFRNKTPKWNQRLKSYALNFGGRVKLASIKNFILIDNQYPIDQEEDADNVIVFGKVDQTTFSLEYRHPLSLYQAFGIVMSEFDFKINCE